MTSTPRMMRPLLLAAVVVALASATSGCGWFGHKPDYKASVENRPLEVPPDLDLPDTSAATSLPPAAGLGSAPAPGVEVTLADSATDAYPKIGKALEGIPGVVVNGRAEALGSYDVTYQSLSFLVRVQDASGGGSRLMALSPDGKILVSGPAAELMKAIKAKL